MINLILPEDKDRVRHTYRARLATVAAGLLMSLLIIFFVGIGSLYLVVSLRQSALMRELETARKESEKFEVNTLQSELGGLADKVKILKVDLETNIPVTEVWQHMLEVRRPGITWRGLFYTRSPQALNKVELALDGNAATRQQFLDFINALKLDPLLTDISYPIDVLLNERDVNFIINLDFNDEKK